MKSSFLPALGFVGLVAAGNPRFAGVNIAGFDFGCGTDGTCTAGAYVQPPASQFTHFTQVDGFNAFRLPVAWQALQPTLGGTLNQTFLALYDQTVQACLASGAYCEIDIHNYARYNGAIIGQGGPTNAQFDNLWTQLATKYAGDSKIIFGIMNEPHDLVVSTWAQTVQTAVTAIRNAGATSQIILLPGSDYTSAGSFISDGSGPALLAVTNPDGSTTNLIFDVHKYLDSDNSGTHTSCTTNNQAAFETLATWLRQNNRQAFLTETGGGPDDASCLADVCQELQTLRDNNDVYLGWLGWAAGSFDQTYTLTETPMANGQDQPLVTQCIAGCATKDCAASTNPSSTASVAPSSTASKTSTATAPSGTGTASKYGQCGGIGWSGPTTCASGSTCTVLNSYYSQCL